MLSFLYRFNPWWDGDFPFSFIVRERYLKRLKRLLNTKDVVYITGLRRSGKTTIMKMLIKELLDSGIAPGRVFYVSLDFYGIEGMSIIDIVEEFMKIQKISFSEKSYLFLDEVAYKENFAVQLKNLYDLYNVKVFASSSSSSILRLGKSFLTGRERVIEVMPLDFLEYLSFKGIRVKSYDYHLLEGYFEEYMETGGIPEYVLTGDPEYIKQLVDDILYKDIVGVHNVRDKLLLRDVFRLLMERSGKQLSYNRIAKVLGISVDTARRFVGFFEEAFLVYTIERCGKLNERLKSPKKVYSGDVGIRNLITGFRDKGAVFENLVFLEIKEKKPCYVYKDGVEIDFFTEDRVLVEAKYGQDMTAKQRKLFEDFDASERLLIDGVWGYLKLLQQKYESC